LEFDVIVHLYLNIISNLEVCIMQKDGIVLLVCCLYFISLIIAGIVAAKRNKNVTDFLVAGRNLGLFLTTATLVAVQVGAGVVLGGAGNGASMGVWPGMYYALGCGGGLILAGIFMAPKLKTADGYVPMDFFEKRYGANKAVRLWAWMSNIPSMLGIFVAQMLACGSILAGFGLPFGWGVVICAAVILVYCYIGGMWGVVLTDLIQTIVILIGIPILAVASLLAVKHAGFAPSSILATPFIPKGLFSKFIYLVLPFLLSISVSYDAYMRYQSAKDVKTARWGCIISGIIVIIIGIFASIVGAVSGKLYPDIQDGVFASMAIHTLHPVMAGIVIAAILAAAMSSANCLLIALGATFSRDFYNKFLHPEKSLEELPYSKRISKITVFVSCLVGVLIAFKLTNILDAIIIFNYPYMGSLLVPLLLGVLWKGATKKGAFAAIFVGGVIGVFCFVLGLTGPISPLLDADWGLLYSYVVSAIVLVGVSLTDKSRASLPSAQ
jgi:SSS family solute:Na+ symporter